MGLKVFSIMRGNNLFLAVLALILFTLSGILIVRGVGEYIQNNDSVEKEVVADGRGGH